MSEESTESLERQYRSKDINQNALFDIGNDWQNDYWGMPSFSQRNAQPEHTVLIHFMNYEDILDFANLIGISVTRKTRSAWFPPGVNDVDKPSEWEWVDGGVK